MPDTFTPEQISQILEEFFKVVGTRQYIGARYVPIFGRKGEESIEWDNTAPYEPLTIVLYQGNSYTSRQFVPVGVEITNQEFWAITGNYNAQVEMYRRETAAAKAAADAAQNDIDTLLPKTDFSEENTVKDTIDHALAVANNAQNDIDKLLPKTYFSEENTVKDAIDHALAVANNAQNDIDTLLPKTDFSEDNTVKQYIDLNKTRVLSFDTVATMQEATGLVAGMTCHTNGFHVSGDGGAAYYIISTNGTANGMDVLALQNELFATLVMTEPYVTPEQFGAYGDGSHDDTAAILAALEKSDFIFMQAHTYYIGGTLALNSISNKKIQGAQGGATLLFNDSTIGTATDNVWLFAMISCSEICFDGVTFDYVPSQSSTTDKTVVDIDGCDKIVFTNCNFYSDKNNSSFTNICTCVWVRKSDATATYSGEVSFDGCEFVNHSGAPSGGCLWVVTHVDSVTLNNCTVSHCTSDEAVGVWSTDGGTVSITNSRAELVKLGVTPSQLVGAYLGGLVTISNSSLLSGTDLGALSFIRAHKLGKIFISDCYVKCDPCNNHMVFKIEDGGGEIQISNSMVEAVSVNFTGDNQRIFECQDANALFKVTDSTFVFGKGKTPSSLTPFTFLSASKGRLQFIGCTFVLENPENFANMLWYFSGATYWQAVANNFIGTAGTVNLSGPTYLTDSTSAANQRGTTVTFNQGAQAAFA